MSGCDSPETQIFANREYVLRMASVLGHPEPPPNTEALSIWPALREIRYPISDEPLDVGRFVELHQCDLGALVGAHNSQLGKLQNASRELDYQRQLVSKIEGCAGFAEAPPWLNQLATDRRALLGQLYWNALFGSEEWAAYAGRVEARGLHQDAALFERFGEHWKSLPGSFDIGAFEQDLGKLNALPRLHPLREEWRHLRTSLTTVAQMLRVHTPRVCPNGTPTPKTHRLVTIFQKYYAAHLRLRIGIQVTGTRETVASLKTLAASVGGHPNAQGWLDDLQGEWRATQAATKAHADAWSDFFERCAVPRAVWADV